MLLLKPTLIFSLVAGVLAQRPSSTPICDYYTTALLKDNSAQNQYKLLTLLVNTVVIGNYTQPNVGVALQGILAPGNFQGQQVNLLPYFNGQLLSSNRGGDAGVSVNFLDDGGAAPLKMNKPSNGNSSNQYKLLTHLYEFFGVLLGCSKYGSDGFPSYNGQKSMSKVHRFMDLNQYEVGYFINQVGLAAASFGVSKDDVTAVGMALNKLFDYRCSPPATVVKEQGPDLQSICLADTCPLDQNSTCSAYPPTMRAKSVNGTTVPGANGTMSLMSPTASQPAQQTRNAAAIPEAAGAALSVVAGAMLFALGL